MGSSGEKRKGRRHLPKVGAAPERAYSQRQEREAVVENFGIHTGQTRGPAKVLVWIVVVMVVIGGLAGALSLAFID